MGAAGFGPKERNLLSLTAAWGLRPHHQTKLLNVGFLSLPPTEVEDVKSNQSQPRTQVNQPDL